jgi:formylglycine-generating enzyme required for sulfatase activity
MALPNPLPDNPTRWDGWRKYNSPNVYERLCLDFNSNASPEVIEDNCRQLMVWWQKKLPLKNQPSNPMAQMLRQGLDEAPALLAEARTILLDPEQRQKVDAELHAGIVASALDEFRKLLAFSLVGKSLTPESEERLQHAARQLGLRDEDVAPVIETELERTGSKRVQTTAVIVPPPDSHVPPVPVVALPTPVSAEPPQANDPFSEFRRLLRMSRLCLEGEEMSDDQRDAMCNLGESLGLTGGQAEDLIDEYLEEVATLPSPPPSQTGRPQPATVGRPAVVAAAKPPVAPVRPIAPAAPKREPINLSPAARIAERQRFPNYVSSLGGEMLLVPTGQFTMGTDRLDAAPNEQPSSRVTLSAFYMARFPITNAQYEKYDPSHRTKRAPWANDNHPVIYVSWNEANAFCRWLSQKEGRRYRLPTEAEWEYAARGGDQRLFPWGNDFSHGRLANFADVRTNLVWRDVNFDDGFAETAPVGSFPLGASPFGVEDMAGNVHEWCGDWYAPYQAKERTNPTGPGGGQQRVLRGGSWRSRMASLRTVARSSNLPGFQSNDIGFRLVADCG